MRGPVEAVDEEDPEVGGPAEAMHEGVDEVEEPVETEAEGDGAQGSTAAVEAGGRVIGNGIGDHDREMMEERLKRNKGCFPVKAGDET